MRKLSPKASLVILCNLCFFSTFFSFFSTFEDAKSSSNTSDICTSVRCTPAFPGVNQILTQPGSCTALPSRTNTCSLATNRPYHNEVGGEGELLGLAGWINCSLPCETAPGPKKKRKKKNAEGQRQTQMESLMDNQRQTGADRQIGRPGDGSRCRQTAFKGDGAALLLSAGEMKCR